MLALAALFVAAAATTCPQFACDANLPAGQCMYYNETTSVTQVNACGQGEVCPFSAMGSSMCEPQPEVELYPGDYCATGANCITGPCMGGLCTNPIAFDNCTNVYDCFSGSFCNLTTLTCAPQRTAGESCVTEYDCMNDMTCVLGACVGYLSLANGAPVDVVEDADTGLTLACASGFSAIIGGSRVCAAAPVSGGLGQQCQIGSLCPDSTGNYHATCVCGYQGGGYCPLFPGDPPVVAMLTNLQAIIAANNACNTYSRFRFTCFAENQGLLINHFNAFQAQYTLFTQGLYPLYTSVSNIDCLKTALLTEYVEQEALANEPLVETCVPYFCLGNDTLEADQCIQFDAFINGYSYSPPTAYISSCVNDTLTCSIANWANSTCEPPQPTRYPGDFCTTHMDCYLGDCENGMCQGALLAGNCSQYYDCNPGTFCNMSMSVPECQPQKGLGELCEFDYDCQNNMACYKGNCTEYFSLAVGQATDSVDDGQFALMCETGFEFQGVCAEAPTSPAGKMGATCTLGTQCPSTLNGYTQQCTCSYNGTNAYCPLFPGDPLGQQALAQLKSLLNYNSQCGTYSRFNEGCFLRFNDAYGPFYLYQSYLTNYTMFAAMQDAHDCYYTSIAADYYQYAVKAALYNISQPKPQPDNPVSSAVVAAFAAWLALE